MLINDKEYRDLLLKKIASSPDIKKERQLLADLFEQSILLIITQTNKVCFLQDAIFCSRTQVSNKNTCPGCLRSALKQAKETQKVTSFICPGSSFGICLPLIQGDAFYGYLVLCHLKRMPSRESLELLEALNKEILEKMQKELELSKLYQTIRPRAIALSTIHTIHRLISSSLDLDELLPRIARLSLQVLRAKRCLIGLVDKKTKRLTPKAMVDLSKRKNRPHIAPKMKRIENRVLHTGNIQLKNSHLSVPLIDEETIGVITVFDKINNRPFDNFDQEILIALAEQAVGAIKNAQLYQEQEEILLGTVKSLTTLMRVRSAYPYTHSKAFVDIVLGIAEELKLGEEDLKNLRYAALLHDAGEIGIPEEILKKRAHLTGKELKIVKEHPKKSAKILSPMEHLKGAIAIIMHHHEKFDGSGYPDKLKGDEIPLGARIMAVADSFEAMISRRPYRQSASFSAALKEIKKHSRTQFDPKVIQAFLKFTKKHAFRTLLKEI